MSACGLHIPDCWDPWQLYRCSASVPLFLVTKELLCGLLGVRQPLASQTKLPTSCPFLPSPLLLPRSYAESRLIRQRENVESSEEALNPDCPIFAATEKRYYPYSPGVPVDPIATSLFLCQFQQPSLTLALYSDHKLLYQLLVEITCHMRRAKAKHNLFSSFLFFSLLFF